MYKYLFLTAFVLLAIQNTSGQDFNSKELSVGDTIPSLTINNIINSDTGNLEIENLYSDGLLIINFWATWCGPCIEEMKLLNDLINKGLKLKVLSVSHDDESKVNDFVNKKDFTDNLIVTTDDKILSDIFKHRYLPHNAWIDSNGKIIAITGGNSISETNIRYAIENNEIDLETKKDDLAFNFLRPLHVEDTAIIYRSIITKQNDRINSGLATREFDCSRFLGWNIPIIDFYWAAYTKQLNTSVDWNLIELNTSDSSKFFRPENPERFRPSLSNEELEKFKRKLSDWDEKNLYSYELRLPHQVDAVAFRTFMFQDLYRFFRVSPSIELRNKECCLIKINGNSAKEKLKESPDTTRSSIRKMRNQIHCTGVTIDDLFQRLKHWFDPQGKPYLNQTGIEYRFDIDFDISSEENALKEIISELKNRYGFVFRDDLQPYPTLVLTDEN